MRSTKYLVPVITLTLVGTPAFGARVKDLADVEGFRDNEIVGVGLVVGLGGTGDLPGSNATQQPLATVLRNLGTNLDPSEIRARNVALVTVTARLPAFSRPGVRFDVTVSSIGTARSLAGGTLLVTALKGLNRVTYATAQGPLVVGGYEATSMQTGSFHRKNFVNVARIPDGGTVEREVPQTLPEDRLTLLLKDPDFTTASRISEAIDQALGEPLARVRDPGAIEVRVSEAWTGKVVGLIAALEAVEAAPDAPARVVVDERTGTVVVGGGVTLGPVALTYSGLTIRIQERFGVSQPAMFARRGQTAIIPDSAISVQEDGRPLSVVEGATTLGDVAKALNALQVTPRDLIAILQALKAAGALRAEIQSM